MPERSGTKWRQIQAEDVHGTDQFGQSSDGTGALNNVPKFDASGGLTDSGIPISSGGGPGTPIGTWVTDEVPVGVLDGINPTFGIAHTPIDGTFSLFLNGVRQDEPRWVQRNGLAITFTVPPISIDFITVNYAY